MTESNAVKKYSSSEDNAREEMMRDLHECADILVEKLQGNDIAGVADIVQDLVEIRDRSLFNEVGKLTRGLHDALMEFHIDADVSEKDENGVPLEMDDASHRLDYVINMMQNAANKTMDSVDEISPIATQFSKEARVIKEEWEKLRRKEIGPEEFRQLYGRIDEFLGSAVSSSNQFSNHLQQIMLAQSFQDLSGQIIRRVISMVKEVETSLVDLVRRSGHVEKMVGVVLKETDRESGVDDSAVSAEGPQVRKRDNAVSSQDEVDDLLSSLGF